MLGINHLFAIVTILLLEFYALAQVPSSHSFRIGMLNGLQNYQLQGTGFNVNSSSSSGKGLNGAYLLRSENKIYFLKAQSYESNVSTPNTISPSEIKSGLKIYDLGISYISQNSTEPTTGDRFLDECKFDLGLQYRERTSEYTSPNRYLPYYQMLGFRLGYQMQKAMSSMWKLEASAGIFLPYYFDERTDKTGSLKIAALPDIEALFVYRVNSEIDFSIGLKALYENITYSGSGSRGVSEAKETYLNVMAPVDLRFTF